jgi:hypothetical protein
MCKVIVLFTLVISATSTAFAGSASGTWKSSSGNTFIVPDSSTDFDLIVVLADGGKDVYSARWVEGMVGTQFVYGRTGVSPCTATFNRRDENRIRVACPDVEPTFWTRVATQHGRPGGIVGNWRSTSGFHFAIPKFSRDEFDILMTSPQGDKTLMKGVWVEGMVGTQFVMGKYTCTFNSQDPDEVRVVASDEKFIWQRE